MSHEKIIDERQRAYNSKILRLLGVILGIGAIVSIVVSLQFNDLGIWIFRGFAIFLLVAGIIAYVKGDLLRQKKENLRYW